MPRPGQDRDGREVYRYDFVPPEVQAGTKGLAQAPLVMIFNNIHGSEKTGAITPLILARDLACNWARDNCPWRLLWHAWFTFVPVLCPYGVENTSRPNGAGVNLNRNFDYNHATAGTNDSEDDWNYRGPTPASESETQYAQPLIDAVKDEASAVIDCHNHITLGANGYFMWTGSDDPESRRILAMCRVRCTAGCTASSSIGLDRITECRDGSLEGYVRIAPQIGLSSVGNTIYVYGTGNYDLGQPQRLSYNGNFPERAGPPLITVTLSTIVAATS